MSFTPQRGDIQISPAVFGGLVTNQAAATLPEGVSPDNQDCAFLPGSVFSRPALQKVFTIPLPATGGVVPTVSYAKTFIGLTGAIENLYLASDGNLYWEDPVAAPGVYNNFGSVAPGSWAKSITAYGREFIAVSDGLHGTDIPLQWDGTSLDRVTQDGPGAAPLVASFGYPSVAMVATGAIVLTVVESDPAAQDGSGNFTRINVFTSSSVAPVNVGDPITLAGYGGASAPMNGTWTILAVYPGTPNSLIVVSASLPATTVFSVSAATGTIPAGTMTRAGNIVTVSCAVAHQLQVGYQSQIAGITAAAIGGGIASIVVNNEDLPGVATITTTTAHGLPPGVSVNIAGVNGVTVGTAITSITWAGGIATVTTSAAHGLLPGSVVTMAATGGAAAFFNVTGSVLSTISATIFTYALYSAAAVAAQPTAATGGTVKLNWPIPDTAAPTYFQVLSAPTTTTFQVALNYCDGTWTTGTISYAWDGTFFVSAVPSSTTFQYPQNGPDATTNVVGTVTPFGQAAPGQRQCQVLFLTRQGYITAPSPPAKITTNGGQYLSVSNIAIGPSNVVARILAFTGAGGSTFFYIPSTAQVNGQVVGTATQINDNVTTDIVLDFSDPTLFAGLGISIPGNDIASQIVLDGALGFGLFSSRLITWGQRNRIQNFLNLGFDGGYLPSAATLPAGWTATGGALAAGHFGEGWQASGAGSLIQPAYENASGAPILTLATKYKFRAWVKGVGTTATATISSALSGFSATAALNGTAAGAFSEANFSLAMPSPIPADMLLTITWTGTPLIDEISVIYQDRPYLETVMYASYVDNPEAFDGVTGKFGSSKDGNKVMDISDIRDTGYMLTQDPRGRLHEFSDNGVTEPAGWTVRQVAANCGLLSAFGLTKSQADDSSASGGEEWFAWASKIGARIFGGDQPWEISREIQPDWAGIVPAYQQYCWALNDPASRTMYFGLTFGGNPQGVANIVYSLNYVGLDSAFAIGTTGPVKIGFTGKRIATDHSRKWTRWNPKILLNGAALMPRGAGDLEPVFFTGNGTTLNTAVLGYGQCYTLNPAKFTDDNYGQLSPYYVTFMMPGDEMEQAKEIAGYRKLLVYLMAYISVPVVSKLTVTPYADQLTTPWPTVTTRTLSPGAPASDIELAANSAYGNRIAVKFSAAPIPGGGATDCGFNLQRFTVWLRKMRLAVRGTV